VQFVKYELEMLLVLCNTVTKHEYIVEIYMYKFSDEFSKNGCHQPLKHSGRITVSLLHCMAYKCAIHGGKHGFPNVISFNAYLFIHIRHIDL